MWVMLKNEKITILFLLVLALAACTPCCWGITVSALTNLPAAGSYQRLL